MNDSTRAPRSRRAVHARLRWAAMLVAGVAAAALAGLGGAWLYAPAVGWAVAALIYNAWVWLAIARMDNTATQAHAVQEDQRRSTSDLLILAAALGSLAAVVLVMVGGAGATGGQKFLLAGLALGTTAMSWLMVHTLFTLRYAEVYYTGPEVGGINFNQDELPQYTDFAYMSFSLGMTYQVSDTNIETRAMRSAALRHSLLAFVFGTGILATTINLVVSLAQ
ncbi:DUF1345 domain-containing protein [Pseudarthrobacter sp. P1]|uniref:DUF1345 domain-containing protein n=1 Tax=Pseudarthrobacter sp. P1 TaxID=3418418 RepID=UPI003CF31CFB